MSSNFEFNKHLSKQRLNKRYAEAELHRMATQKGTSGVSENFKLASALRQQWNVIQKMVSSFRIGRLEKVER